MVCVPTSLLLNANTAIPGEPRKRKERQGRGAGRSPVGVALPRAQDLRIWLHNKDGDNDCNNNLSQHLKKYLFTIISWSLH